jgi:hypothetical protein
MNRVKILRNSSEKMRNYQPNTNLRKALSFNNYNTNPTSISFSQSYFDNDDDNSVITVQPVIYKEMPSSLTTPRLASPSQLKKVSSFILSKNDVLIGESTQLNNNNHFDKVIHTPSMINFEPTNNGKTVLSIPSYYAFNDLNVPNIKNLFSKPVLDVVEKQNEDDETKTEQSRDRDKQNESDNNTSVEELSLKSEDKSVKDLKVRRNSAQQTFYLRKKYYLFYNENQNSDDENLPTRCVCCVKQFYGCPCYIWTLLFFLLFAIIGIITWLTYTIIYTQNLNQTYFAACTSNSDCDVDKLLHCAVENSACLCPASLSTGRCDCSPGYYWSGTKCALLMDYGALYCAADYNCDSTKFLKCVNQTCACGYQMQWNTTTRICDYVYEGCYTDSLTITTFQSQTARINYFVEICIDTCTKMKTKYALTSYNGAVNNCYCNSTFDTSVKTSCEIFCPGSNSNGRRCGSMSGSLSDKAVYRII